MCAIRSSSMGPSDAERRALTGCMQASHSLNVCAGAEERQQTNHGSNSSSSQGAQASHGAMGVKRDRNAEPQSQALQGEPRRSQRGVRMLLENAHLKLRQPVDAVL